MVKISRSVVDKLNNGPAMAAFNATHPSSAAAGAAFVALCEVAAEAGLSILAVTGGRTLETGTVEYVHPVALRVDEFHDEDDDTNCRLVRQVHEHDDTGAVEVVAYLS